MTVILPPDVIDYIFSFLQPDTITLRKCSEAHPFLASLAERHLYVYIALQNHPTQNNRKFLPSEILKLFAERPEILNNIVQGLSIELLPLQKAEMRRSLEDISLILSIEAPKLRSVTLKGRSPVGWRNLDQTFQTAFLNCINSPLVTEVSIEDIAGFRLSQLFECKGLKHLVLGGRFRQTTDPVILLFETTPSKLSFELESLSLYNCIPLLNLIYWPPLRDIHVLNFHPLKAEDFSMWHSVLKHFLCLRCLRVDLSRVGSFRSSYNLDNRYQHSPFSLSLPSGLNSLREVTFHAVSSIKTSSRLYYSALPDIDRCLRVVPFLNHITLHLHFEVEDDFFFHERDSLCIQQSIASHCNSLNALHIKLHISAATAQGPIPPSDILSVLEEDAALMEMANRGVLFFTAETHFCRHLSCCN